MSKYDHLLGLFTFFRWILVWVDVVVLPLSWFVDLMQFSFVALALVCNVLAGVLEQRGRRHSESLKIKPKPRIWTMFFDYFLGTAFLALWVWQSIWFSEVFQPNDGADPLNSAPIVLVSHCLIGGLVMCHFHWLFATVQTYEWRLARRARKTAERAATELEILTLTEAAMASRIASLHAGADGVPAPKRVFYMRDLKTSRS